MYSDRRANRNENIATNPRVSLHLNDDGKGDGIVVLGARRGSIRPCHRSTTRRTSPSTGDLIRDLLGSAEEFATIYNVPLRIRPTRGVAFGL